MKFYPRELIKMQEMRSYGNNTEVLAIVLLFRAGKLEATRTFKGREWLRKLGAICAVEYFII